MVGISKTVANVLECLLFCIWRLGVASEACSLAGHLGLGRLIVLYDSNSVTIDGDTSLSFTENVIQRFNSYGWHTQTVKDGDRDLSAILQVGRAMSEWGNLWGSAESICKSVVRDGQSGSEVLAGRRKMKIEDRSA